VDVLPLTAADVATVSGGRLVQGDATAAIGRVSIDSRTVSAGEFFVAIRGDRFDGHRFVAAALERGAAGAMVDSAVPQGGGSGSHPVVIEVKDTLRGLQDLARSVRQRSGARVVAITGSAGKTTTKEIAAEFLEVRHRVFRNKGNLNNHIGLPLSLMELRTQPDIAVVELGMNHPGEIRTLVGIAEPEVRVWTNVGDAHLGFFPSADVMADAKAEILERARAEDLLIANADDPRVMARAHAFAGRLTTFGTAPGANVRATNVEHRGLDGMAADLGTSQGSGRLEIPLLGLGNLSNVLAATALALHFEVPLEAVLERARRLTAARHRGELLRLPGGITLIDDSYNSSPSALKRALETVRTATGSARKVAVLGEMLELGEHALRLHAECGAAAAAGLDVLIAVGGPPAEELARAAVANGLPQHAVTSVRTKEEAANAALQRIRPGDLVLVKGSRGIGTDLVVDRLSEEFG
jgi:UDP-N-acetylmuramoyl-tripeptide--D-alanyl-D-alanine ligase